MKLNKFTITAATTTAITIVLNIAAYFYLPQKIITQIGFTAAGNLSSVVYLLMSAFIVAVSAGMIVFSEKYQPAKRAKWIAANIVITILNIVIIIYNLIIK